MIYSKETQINLLNYRIGVLRARSEIENLRLINALIREKRLLEASAQN